MRTLPLAIMAFFIVFQSVAQTTPKLPNKYPSLLWEIKGKGLTKPSYLFGTMHVSSKMVFHLSDSFYIGIKNADVVALETNPGTWQEDFSRYDLDFNPYGFNSRYRNGYNGPSDYLSIKSLKGFPYEKMLAASLYSNPAMINNFLYRSNSERYSDFEEDTYLDLYIYQIGKKWNKKLSGVEDFDESMTLVREAYADAAKDKSKRDRNFDVDKEFSYAKLDEAYRTGNLDLIDTIQKLNSSSPVFDEKFLYKRNEIQAKNIDSILKTKAALFVGVGAAHLPGHRGVIEMLRQMGYTLRPIKMTERDSRNKEIIEQLRVPVSFSTYTAPDNFYQVNIPGKLYSFSEPDGLLNQQQYADMANGSYYIVSRLQTNAMMWGHSTADVLRKVDSLLYENIPGKILEKKKIVRNGYHGFEITNRTRRGDFQRYNIFVTPNEVVLFKMSGNGDYVSLGNEAEQFFSSIKLKEYVTDWKRYSPAFGGFEVEMPHQPWINNIYKNWYFLSNEKETGTTYQVIRTDIHNINFVEEDSFDLNLLEESFSASEFIDKKISSKHSTKNGYSVLDAKYRYKNGSVALVKYIIQGPHYYTIVANGRKEHAKMKAFLNSFTITPFLYGEAFRQYDTSLHFTVNSPVRIHKEKKLQMYPEELFRMGNAMDDEAHLEEYGSYKDRIIESDSTGEKIYVSIYKPGKYYYDDDTAEKKDSIFLRTDSQDWIYRVRKEYKLPNNTEVFEFELGDPLSSRVKRGKSFSRDGIFQRFVVQGDTTTPLSSFVTSFMESFMPVDTVKGVDPLQKKSGIFLADFFSTDSTERKRAIKNIRQVKFDSTDFAGLKKAIESLNWSEKKYLDIKNQLIAKLSEVPTPEAADYLKAVYFAAGDTIEVQYKALNALLAHENSYSYQVFKEIMINEPPVLILNTGNNYGSYTSYSRENFFDALYDSLELTRSIFADILPLININDYEDPVTGLLESMIDSNMVTTKDYEMYYSKFMIEARQEMKKQVISEKKKSIKLAQKDEDEEDNYYSSYSSRDYGNSKLSSYATLLMPFWDQHPAVPALFKQLLSSNDKKLKLNTVYLMIRNNRPLPDTMLSYFAGLDEYRYQLYLQLRKMKKLELFPAKHFNHVSLAKSELYKSYSGKVSDTFAFLTAKPVKIEKREGLVYFFKYKTNKEDNNWKLAVVGLVEKDPKKYLFDLKTGESYFDIDLTERTDEKLDEEESLDAQLNKLLKKKLYSKRKSAAEFYENDVRYNDYLPPVITD